MILEAGKLSNEGDSFVDGAVIAAARTLPTWSDRDMPPIPSLERKAVKELQEECLQMLAEFPTTSEQDQKILGINSELVDFFWSRKLLPSPPTIFFNVHMIAAIFHIVTSNPEVWLIVNRFFV